MTGRTDFEESTSNPRGSWKVCRQDDNGNQYVVEKGLTEAEAYEMLAEFESHGHKQLYWIEAEPE